MSFQIDLHNLTLLSLLKLPSNKVKIQHFSQRNLSELLFVYSRNSQVSSICTLLCILIKPVPAWSKASKINPKETEDFALQSYKLHYCL